MRRFRYYFHAVVAFSLVALPIASTAQSAPGEAPAIQTFLQAYNASDQVRLEAFARSYFDERTLADQPPSALAHRYIRRRDETGALTYRGTAMASPQHTEVLAESASHRWYQLTLEGSPAPSRFADITIDPTLSPPKYPQHPRNTAEFVRAVNAYVDQLTGAGEFSGTLLAAQNGRPVLERAAGRASIESNVPNRTDTRFNIGSIAKVFTQVAILQLVQSGKLQANDTIGKWLPQYPNEEARRATVLQLLTMRSGIGDFFGPEFAAASHGRLRALADYLPFFAAKPLAFKPGANEMYSNGGYLVLGLIVEKASGQSYYDYVRDRVFSPAAMQNTGYPQLDDTSSGRATGYTQTPHGLRNAMFDEPARGSSAGGAYSTVRDLMNFTEALRAGRLLDESYTRWLLQRFPGDGPRDAQTLHPGNDVFAVAGGTPGSNALLLSDARGSAIVVLANLDPPAAEALGRQIRRWSVESTPR